MENPSTGQGRLAGKCALVTAAGQGIGASVVAAYAAEGATVLATDINEAALAQWDDQKGIATQHLDVTDSAQVQQVVAAAGAVDILFNCAGFVHSGSILDSDDAEWDFAFDLNVKSMYRLCKAVLPGMLERGQGSIINMSSVASSIKAVPNRFVYSATKAAVIGLTKSIATDFVVRGVRCNAICPATVESPSLHERLKATGDHDKAMKEFIARQPMGRLGRPEEIAALAVYLASDESGFTTGQTHIIDGAWTA